MNDESAAGARSPVTQISGCWRGTPFIDLMAAGTCPVDLCCAPGQPSVAEFDMRAAHGERGSHGIELGDKTATAIIYGTGRSVTV